MQAKVFDRLNAHSTNSVKALKKTLKTGTLKNAIINFRITDATDAMAFFRVVPEKGL